ncbi:hypothetical protein RvY_08813 [Ramazzottius varieornatus]|uniref:VWFD domain-containing protein n=1 Tax=Ramazzottius varieornatus TaxID=947166 RepID=A0A1D1VGC7_RAMVA|nr:hypothetical protein RvY_08813 [Ramazzottius varieornatus]
MIVHWRWCIKDSLPRWSGVLLLMFCIGVMTRASGQFLQGEPAYCQEEGADIEIPDITTPCITCKCVNYKITCERRKCPHPAAGKCYFHLYDTEDEDRCCNRCKGCQMNNQTFSSGEKWESPVDPCASYQCNDGIITKTVKTVCYATCSNPVPVKDQCCAVCKGCYANGKAYAEGDVVPITSDPCVTCRCENGSLICDKNACPVLACSVSNYIYDPANPCCPKCDGFRKIVSIKNKCMIGLKVLKPDQQYNVDQCTTCVCMQASTVLCKRSVCPVLLCPTDFQQRRAGECCPRCQSNALLYCETEEATYQNGQTWNIADEPCAQCKCENGHVKCTVQTCSTIQCKPDEVEYKDQSLCCSICVPKTATCTVYGDPHYKSFDGKSFSFQGRCKYIAVEDCNSRKHKRFEVQLRNNARRSSHFTWTKSVAIFAENLQIVLLQKLRVRVDRKEVKLPYFNLGAVNIVTTGYNIIVRTALGMKVVWDGDSFVEITMPWQYRNQVCGLCGNYNGNSTDDFALKETKKITEDVAEFATSWLVGKKGDTSRCAIVDTELPQQLQPRSRATRNLPCPNSPLRKSLRIIRECSIFKSTATRNCRRLVDPSPYWRACLVDLCDCPRRSCLCQSFGAFLRECELKGENVDNLRRNYCKLF